MGIPGIYTEIGNGERIALSKVAVDYLERNGRPLRIAIDISIWQFQIQSGQGGKNPALRTFYYRLLRLLALSIQPLFVFDGPHKPPFKRGRKVAPGAACRGNVLTKELLKHFGFPYHTAPGEAEAECALLQKEKIVDAVLSEDVDTMMFGCSMTMRNWTPEGKRSTIPTHVNVYKAESIKKEKGLDSEGMILIALMSGGDYVPDGIPKCGMKTACEAAKAGFGRDLCQLSKDDTDGIKRWREKLQRELQTNESKFFQTKHKKMKIPENFPNNTALGFYTHPAVSSAEEVARLRNEIRWDLDVNIPELRMFVASALDWQYLSGAKKFIRGLAPALLIQRCISRSQINTPENDDLKAKEIAENRLVKSICGRRNHFNTGGEPELRIAYIPIDVVGLNIDAEEKSDQGYGQDASGDELPASEDDEIRGRSQSPTKRRGPSNYDPARIERIWILETHVKLGVPLLVETWEEEMRNPKKFASRKAREKAKTASSKGGIEPGALEQYGKLTKPIPDDHATKLPAKGNENTQLPPAIVAPTPVDMPASQQRKILAENMNPVGRKAQKQRLPAEAKATRTRKAPSTSHTSPPKDRTTNPWTLAKRTPEKPRFRSPPRDTSQELDTLGRARSQDGRLCLTTLPSAKKRHSRPTTPISEAEDPTETPRAINGNVTLRKGKPSTPIRHDPTKPSPRKKRSPLQMANDLYLAGQLRTPTRKPQDAIGTMGDADPLTSHKVNRRIDFTFTKTQGSAPPAPAAASSPPSLPSPSTLLSPTGPPSVETVTSTEPARLLSKVQPPPAKAVGTGRLVALRESLEGAWKYLEEPREVGGGSSNRRVFSSVEVLDLTGG